MSLLDESANENVSHREVGQLIQVTTVCAQRGLVHLQQHRKRGSINVKWVGQLLVVMVRQCLPSI